MAKVLVSVRLPQGTVSQLRELAKSEGVSQADLVVNSIALFQSFSSYKRKLLEDEKHCESVVDIQLKGDF